ncbi:MAG: Nif3-like dinuclear metal center hexameric protein [Rhodothermales bacterium]|nr:Nif3-like dinuclear metal center hexameric protein [Rhodothermales bacterium]
MHHTPLVTVRDLIRFLDGWAPPALQQPYDNTGLQVGNPDAEIAGAVVALDLTHAVLDEAKAQGANVVVTHHPLLFKPVKRLAPGPGPSGLAYRLAAEGIAHVAAHTNLDAIDGGVSFALAEDLGLEDVRLLDGFAGQTVKLAVFVPESHAEAVREALAEAGAGRAGRYDACAFATPGTGTFRPLDGADPFVGTVGALERVDEIRLEAEVLRARLPQVLAAMRAAHPYEEVAFDVYPVERVSDSVGFGAIGTLPEAEAGAAFLARVAERLGERALRYAGDLARPVRRVAVCGGAGVDLAGKAMAAGADAYVTADVTYHRFFDVLDGAGRPAMLLVDALHYATERCAERLLADTLAAAFPSTTFRRTEIRTAPVKTFVA